jgi:carboxyl-terminal processing protease
MWYYQSKNDDSENKADKDAVKKDKMTEEEAIAKLRRRYASRLKQRHSMKGEALLELYLSSLTRAYDPHTTYMSPTTLDNFEIAMRLKLKGIGASLQSEDGYTVIKKIIPGGAADKDGRLKVEDKIIGVGQGKEGELEDIVDLNINDVVKQIRGKPDTVVRLQVVPANGSGTKVYDIVRAEIELKDSEAQAAD